MPGSLASPRSRRPTRRGRRVPRGASPWPLSPSRQSFSPDAARHGHPAASKPSGSSSGTPEPWVPAASESGQPAPVLLDPSDRTLPIERFLLTTGQRRELTAAQYVLAAGCVARYGLSFTPPAMSSGGANPRDAAGTSANTARRYGVVDAGAAVRAGYHLPGPGSSFGHDEPQPTAEVLTLLTGAATRGSGVKPDVPATTFRGRPLPPGGCTAEAARASHGRRTGDLDDEPLAREVNVSSFDRTMITPSVVQAVTAWSSCMKKSGFSFTSPVAAPGPQLMSQEQAGAEERAIAVADVACKRATNLVGTWSRPRRPFRTRRSGVTPANSRGSVARSRSRWTGPTRCSGRRDSARGTRCA